MQQRKTIGQRPQWPLPCFHFVFAVQIPNHSCVLVRTDYNKNCTIDNIPYRKGFMPFVHSQFRLKGGLPVFREPAFLREQEGA